MNDCYNSVATNWGSLIHLLLHKQSALVPMTHIVDLKGRQTPLRYLGTS